MSILNLLRGSVLTPPVNLATPQDFQMLLRVNGAGGVNVIKSLRFMSQNFDTASLKDLYTLGTTSKLRLLGVSKSKNFVYLATD